MMDFLTGSLYKPIRWIFQGNVEKSRGLIGEAKRVLFQLKNIQSTGSKQFALSRRYTDGSVISCDTSVAGMDIVRVYSEVKPPVGAKRKGKKVEMNLLSCETLTDTIYKHEGFSSTILESFDSPGAFPRGLAWDGTNLLSGNFNSATIYKHEGFSSTILESFHSPGFDPTGLAWDGTNLLSCDALTDKIYKHEGFSSTILESFDSPGTFPTGLAWDGTNLLSCDAHTDTIYKHEGFSSTILESFDSPGFDPNQPGTYPTGLAWVEGSEQEITGIEQEV